ARELHGRRQFLRDAVLRRRGRPPGGSGRRLRARGTQVLLARTEDSRGLPGAPVPRHLRRGKVTRIRPAQDADAEAIARVHVEAWRESYRGLVPDEVLARLSVERRANDWRTWLGDADGGPIVRVAEDEAGAIVGFASGGRARDPRLATDAEV